MGFNEHIHKCCKVQSIMRTAEGSSEVATQLPVKQCHLVAKNNFLRMARNTKLLICISFVV